jgi:predicted transcriptional regulator
MYKVPGRRSGFEELSPKYRIPFWTIYRASTVESQCRRARLPQSSRYTTGMNFGIINAYTMKTAVSLDDDLLHQADEAARQMGLSRSRLFAAAISEFLHWKKQEKMLRQLKDIYAGGATAVEKRLLKGMKSKVRAIAERE